MKHDNSDYLIHHGIKGMKWGIRRTREQLGRLAGGSEGRASKKKARQQLKEDRKNISKLSDKELQARVNRLNLEANYLKLTAPKQGAVSKLLGKIRDKALESLATKGADWLMKKIFDEDKKTVTPDATNKQEAPNPKKPKEKPMRPSTSELVDMMRDGGKLDKAIDFKAPKITPQTEKTKVNKANKGTPAPIVTAKTPVSSMKNASQYESGRNWLWEHDDWSKYTF